MGELMRQNLIFICWLSSLFIKKLYLPAQESALGSRSASGSWAALDYTGIIMNLFTEEVEVPVINFIKTLLENKERFMWLFMWLFMLFYLIGLGIIINESKDFDDFCERMMLKKREALAIMFGDGNLKEEKDTFKIRMCWHCLEFEKPQKKCSGCRKARYCGEECQREDWGRHGEWCKKKGWTKKERSMKKKRINTEESTEVD